MLRRVAVLLPIVLNPGWREFIEHPKKKKKFNSRFRQLIWIFLLLLMIFEIVCFIVQNYQISSLTLYNALIQNIVNNRFLPICFFFQILFF